MQTISVPSPQKKEIDINNVKVGSTLRHKAVGLGTVKALNGGRMIVIFDGIDKLFQFPGAILRDSCLAIKTIATLGLSPTENAKSREVAKHRFLYNILFSLC